MFSDMPRPNGGSTSDEIKRLTTFKVTVPTNTSYSYGSIELDVSGVNTLSLIANKTDGTVNVSYINLYASDGTTVIKQYSVSSSPQTVDVSAHDMVKLLILINTGTTAYKGVIVSNIQMY